ncbi:isochorismatase family protein [Nitrospirillum iridis]|uniref:Nicotinamidase-related amidase n=1 Tax=Nitrospirillum iridis TaxID=765888 RepID=A0A7X0EF69_9PROT|nr:nicotinamidase-related amidase [Nitrospirillum iridis]
MPPINPSAATLVVIDLQARLIPAIQDGPGVVANTRRLLTAAGLLGVPAVYTEQNPRGLGATVPDLAPDPAAVIAKMTFDATRAPGLLERLPPDHAVVLAGCETHVCVLQTALGLLDRGRRVHVVADAVGSRTHDNKAAGLRRMERHGADIITTEMALFEWLGTADHPRFREVVALIK